MTPKQKARMEFDNFSAGVKLGSSIAQAVVDKYPHGFDDAKSAALAEEIKQSESAASAVIPKRFRESFVAGLVAGRRSTFEQHTEKLVLRAVYGKSN